MNPASSDQLFEKVANIEFQTYLNRFPSLKRTAFDPDHAAIRGTHCDPAIDNILNWFAGAGEDENIIKRVFLLLGPAGSGKSSVAHFVAQHFYEQGQLGCGIFLHSGIENRNSATISGTIIQHLAQFHPAIKQRMSGLISNPDVAQADIGRQFGELIVIPLEGLEMVGPVLVIIDGLDSCEDIEDRYRVLSILANDSLMSQLPPNFRFLVTSCKQDIYNIFKPMNHVYHHTMSLPTVEQNEILIQTTLNDPEVARSPDGYSIDRMRHKFWGRSGGDVVWTLVACRALQLASIQRRLSGFTDILLIQPPPATLKDSITQLHASIFDALNSNRSTPPYIVLFHTLLLFGTDYVFSLVVINHDQGSEEIDDICKIARGLGIVILPTITSMDASLRDVLADFFTKERRCVDHAPYVEQCLCGLAEACLDRMNESLEHNICGLPTTFHLDIEITGLTRLIEKRIPKDLQYAVTNWIAYILEVQHPTEALMEKLHELLFVHLLHWIEVLSLIRRLDEEKVCRSLQLFGEYILSRNYDRSHSKLCEIIQDAIDFLRSYSSVISQAHLHTYISALPLFSFNKLLHQTYIEEIIDDRPRVSSSSRLGEVDPLYFVKRHYSYVCCSVALSPNGSQLVDCGDDLMVRICDGPTGEEVRTMKGHSHWVRCAVFSPNGERVASCSNDKTVCVWDVQTGRLLNKLTGHNNTVIWVEFSLDGSKLVSRSFEDIITWNSYTGNVIGKRDIGAYHECATFSPDGLQVATTSSKKILIFDIKLKHQIAMPDRHKCSVERIAWSFDGSQLASSSKTETLLWDTKHKSIIAVLIDTNTDSIKSLRFTANQLSLVTQISDIRTFILHTWDLNTPNYNRVSKLITRQSLSSVDVRLDLGQVVAGTKGGDILMWNISSLPKLSPKVIHASMISSYLDNLLNQDIITFHEPFDALRSAHHVDLQGWVCTKDEQKTVWVSKHQPPYTIKCSVGKLEFLDHEGRTRLVMESSSIG